MHRTSFDANQEELMNYKLPPQALLFALLSLEFSDTNPPLSTLSLSLSLASFSVLSSISCKKLSLVLRQREGQEQS